MNASVSRRSLLEGAAVLGALAGVASAPCADAEVSEVQKISHADAKYQSTPNGQQRCEICIQFEPPDHCKIISSNGWCQYFAARENAH